MNRIKEAAMVKEKQEEEEEHMGRQIDITKLLLFGLLYCKGSHSDKCERFWDILQQLALTRSAGKTKS